MGCSADQQIQYICALGNKNCFCEPKFFKHLKNKLIFFFYIYPQMSASSPPKPVHIVLLRWRTWDCEVKGQVPEGWGPSSSQDSRERNILLLWWMSSVCLFILHRFKKIPLFPWTLTRYKLEDKTLVKSCCTAVQVVSRLLNLHTYPPRMSNVVVSNF